MSRKRHCFSECRKQLGTQAEVAAKVGISTVYLRKIESGDVTPGRDLMFRLSNLFAEQPEKLFPDFFESVACYAQSDN